MKNSYRCHNINGVRISEGNVKTGEIASVSLPPKVTCPACPCWSKCYADKLQQFRKEVKAAWQGNLDVLSRDRDLYFYSIEQYLASKQPDFFRFHVSGDFPDQDYLDRVIQLSRDYNDGCNFLAFTKRFGFHYRDLPSNLSIVFSAWPGATMPDRRKNLPIAWVQDGTETRIPNDAIQCPGNCETCGLCWKLKDVGHDVWFKIH